MDDDLKLIIKKITFIRIVIFNFLNPLIFMIQLYINSNANFLLLFKVAQFVINSFFLFIPFILRQTL